MPRALSPYNSALQYEAKFVFCLFVFFLFPGKMEENELLFKSAAAATKSLQSCPSLCDPIDGSPSGSIIPGILQARTLEWVAVYFSKYLPQPPHLYIQALNFSGKYSFFFKNFRQNHLYQNFPLSVVMSLFLPIFQGQTFSCSQQNLFMNKSCFLLIQSIPTRPTANFLL